jgi:hypothetical protein
MGKSELINVKKHLKMRLRDCKGIYTLASLLIVLFLLDTINIVKQVLNYQSEVKLISVNVYSTAGFALMLLACIYYTFQYSEYHASYLVYPQSSFTRFFSYEAYCYLTHIIIQLLALGLYLLQYLLCYVLNMHYGNIRFAYPINIPFILTGFFITLLYGFLLISFIELISVIVRKFRWIALLFYVAVLVVLWIAGGPEILNAFISFYLEESSIPMFLLKGISTWMLFEVLLHWINIHTNKFKVKTFVYKNIMIAAVLLLSFLGSVIASLSSFNTIKHTESNLNLMNNPEDYINDSDLKEASASSVYSLDTAGLPKNTALTLELDAKIKNNYMILCQDPYDNKPYYNNTADRIQIYFLPVQNITNQVDLNTLINPKIEASLKNNQLSLRVFNSENIKVISIYPYSYITQFQAFQDRPYAKKGLDNIIRQSPGVIRISTPKGKNITITQ